jgi:chorismate synthase
MSSTTGLLFRVTTWGESHGPALGAVVDGCPPGVHLSADDIQPDLDRRRPGQSRLSSQRKEPDRVEIASGVFEGRTTGTPISLRIENADAEPGAYDHLKDLFRPSHADFTYHAKFGGHRDWRGGGRASARETASRTAAGAIARKLLLERWGVEVVAWVDQVGEIGCGEVDATTVDHAAVDAHLVRCPDAAAAARMQAEIEAARSEKDTVGGVVACVARGVPVGWGEPVFDRLEADLAKACLSLPAAKGFESGSGFGGTRMRGSEHNDAFEPDGQGGVRTRTNRSGGIQGGISNGMPVLLRVAFKPVATHFLEQETVGTDGRPVRFSARGRHDPCVLPRAVPIVEAAVLLTLADHALRHAALVDATPAER